jgi:hypothetical protein
MNEFIQRLLPPGLAAALMLLLGWDLVPSVPGAENWNHLGLLLPALWLASISAKGLEERGGLLMRLVGYEPKISNADDRRAAFRLKAAVVALLWLLVALLLAGALYWWSPGETTGLALFGALMLSMGFHACLFACFGVFTLLAMSPEKAG